MAKPNGLEPTVPELWSRENAKAAILPLRVFAGHLALFTCPNQLCAGVGEEGIAPGDQRALAGLECLLAEIHHGAGLRLGTGHLLPPGQA